MKKTIFALLLAACITFGGNLKAQNELPSREERVYALSVIWKEMLYNFAFPETLKEVNIDSLYKAYLPKVEQATDYYDFYRTLSLFTAQFNEAHTRIYTSNRPDDAPPVDFTNIGDVVIVSNIAASLSKQIPVGSRVLEVNNIPVVSYIKDSVYPYISAATPHWKFDKSVTEMLYGRPQTTVSLTVLTPKGKQQQVEMVRDRNTAKNKHVMLNSDTPPISIQVLDKNIGYIKLGSFVRMHLKTIDSVFASRLPELRNCKGLIIDIRGNRGGTDQAWESILKHLLAVPEFHNNGVWWSRMHVGAYKLWGEYMEGARKYYLGTAMVDIDHDAYKNEVPDSLKLHQPLVVVSGQYVGSASEDFLTLIKETKRATVVGGPSIGCMGHPMFVPLTGGLELMLCVKKYVNPDGSQPNDAGILPDIAVEASYADYLKGKDNILERAVEEVKKKM